MDLAQEAIDSAAAQLLIEIAFAIPKGDQKALVAIGDKVLKYRDAITADLRARLDAATMERDAAVGCWGAAASTVNAIRNALDLGPDDSSVEAVKTLRARLDAAEQELAKLKASKPRRQTLTEELGLDR